MRCLYCGKELALLKRWTGGGEFCSDAHRQQYQDEYNQLALNRLLQAKPPLSAKPAATAEAKAPPVPTPQAAPAAAPERPLSGSRIPQTEPQFAAASPQTPAPDSGPPRVDEPQLAPLEPIAGPERRAPEPEPDPEEEPVPAGIAGFCIDPPVPAPAEMMAMARPDPGFESGSTPALPRRRVDAWETQLVAAGLLESAPFTCIVDWAARPRDRKLDARDFVRTAPLVEVDLDPAGETELPEMSEEHMDILIFPHPPQMAPRLWEEPWLEFAFDKDLGALARVTFRTTGVEDNEDASDSLESLSELSPAPALLAPLAPPLAQSPPAAWESGEVKGHTRPVAATAAPPIPVPEIAKPLAMPAAQPTLHPASHAASHLVTQAAPAAPKKTRETPPLLTKALPVTLHGLAAGRGKPVQVFAAVTAGIDLQIPRSSALPLRPVMTLGPALGGAVEEKKLPERTVVVKVDVKVDPRKNPPSRPDPRLANGKGRRDTRAEEVQKKEPEQKSAAGIAPVKPAPVKPAEKRTEQPAANPAAKPIEKTPEKLPESSLPPAPYSPPDLGLPSLNLEASGGFWKRLPLAGKAGLALTMLAMAMAIVFIMKSGTSSAAAGPRIVEAPAITGVEGGWITDWGVEPGVRKSHDISVLRPTLNMADYRIQFEAQIESKALGWIYRAANEKNYYVSKLEIVKPGLNPTVALVRYAVVKGEEQPHAQFPLNMPVRVDTTYKIRFDAVGDHFTTWVQDQKVDDWTDERFKTGGVGLYSDRGESISLKKDTLRVAPLVLKK